MHYTIICLGSSWGKKWINLERVLDRVALVPFALQFIHKTYFPIYRFYFNYEGMSDRAGGREMVEEGSFLLFSVGYRPSFSGLGLVSRSFGSLVFSSEQEVGVPS